MLLLAATALAAGTMVPDATPSVVTDDGWTLPIRHYAGPGDPVLLVHGMGVNHYNFDWRPDVSLADWLQEHGWDVWVAELRGDDGTTPPSKEAARSWTFEDHARRDLPAIVDGVLAATQHEKLAWVGHSMGGMLLYTALTIMPEKISVGVAISSPARFTEKVPVYRTGQRARFLTRGPGKVPITAVAPSLRVLGRGDPVARVLSNPRNMAPDVIRGLMADATTDVPKAVGRELLTWIDGGALVDSRGEPWVTPADVPLLALGGVADRFVPWQNVAAACDIYPRCTFRRLGIADGFSVDYGHVDTTIGATAAAEIYPIVGAFLAESTRPEHE